MRTAFSILLLTISTAYSQITQFPYLQNFDSATPPNLPVGWGSTQNRTPGTNDFTTAAGSARSSPNAVLSTNARISQTLISPRFDFTGRVVDSLAFYERRSNTDTTGVLVEASTDGGTVFAVPVGDTLQLQNPGSYVRRAFALPPILSGDSDVTIRWRVLGDQRGGATATLRFDDVVVTTRTQLDVGLTSISLTPQFPVSGDSVRVFATVRNFGSQASTDIPVEFYHDVNQDSIPQTNELFDSVRVSTVIQPGDSQVVSSRLVAATPADNQIIVQTVMANDENRANDRGIVVFSVGVPRFSVVLNEIMYGPTSPEPEWLELYNVSADSVNLRNWRIANRNTGTRYTIATGDRIVRRGEYLVMTKDTALFLTVHPDVPSVVIQIPTLPTFFLNNNGDAAVVFDSRGMVMDSAHYSVFWGGTGGRSLERVDASLQSNDSLNWGSSEDSAGSTPGKQNSLTPADFDLGVAGITVVGSGTSVVTRATVVNAGRNPAQTFGVSLFYDANNDSIPQVSEQIGQQQPGVLLQPHDSVRLDFAWSSPGYGLRSLIVEVDYPEDLRIANNRGYATARVTFPSATLVINEIMYAPLTGQAEFVELYNKSGTTVDLHDWKISDMRDASGQANEVQVAGGPHIVQAGAYVILASDSTIVRRFNLVSDSASGVHLIVANRSLSLNNEGDDVVLVDLTGSDIDSLRYSPGWHNPQISDVTGRSLERINPDLASTDRRNWNTSADPLGGSPGKRNSIFTASVPVSSALFCSPSPFSPDGDGFEDFAIISYEIPVPAGLLRIRIFDAVGRLVRTLVNGEQVASRGSIVWDGMDDGRNKARMGIYIVFLEALDASGSTTYSTRGLVVVAVKL